MRDRLEPGRSARAPLPRGRGQARAAPVRRRARAEGPRTARAAG